MLNRRDNVNARLIVGKRRLAFEEAKGAIAGAAQLRMKGPTFHVPEVSILQKLERFSAADPDLGPWMGGKRTPHSGKPK